MKFGVLQSIGHNIADSLASGCGLMVGVYDMDVFGEAERSPEGFIEVDFLNGGVTGATPSDQLRETVGLYAKSIEGLCQSQGATSSDFKILNARYSGRLLARQFIVEVEDRHGRSSRDKYVGTPGSRPKTLDPLGRIRRGRSA